MNHLRKNKRGVVLIASLGIMMMLFFLGASFLLMVRQESENNKNFIDSLKAFYMAESGVAYMIAHLRRNGLPASGKYSTPRIVVNDPDSSQFLKGAILDTSDDYADGTTTSVQQELSFSAELTKESKDYMITAYGNYGTMQRAVQVDVAFSPVVGALQAGNGISIRCFPLSPVCNAGYINGSVFSNNVEFTPKELEDIVNFGESGKNKYKKWPLPQVNSWGNLKNIPGITVMPGGVNILDKNKAISGAYYIEGDLTMNGSPGGSDFFNCGSTTNPCIIVVIGNVTFSDFESITLFSESAPNHVSIIATGDIVFRNCSLSTYGLYAGGDIQFVDPKGGYFKNIRDPIIAQDEIIIVSTIFQLDFDNQFEKKFLSDPFNRVGSVIFKHWRGYEL